MIKYGLTKEGFIKKRYADIIKEKEAKAKELFGDDVNLSESSPLGLFIQLNAWEESTIWEMAENVYFSSFLDSAVGISLDRVAQYIGIRRLQATRAKGTIQVTGTAGTYIPAESIVSTIAGDLTYSTNESLTLSSQGEGEVEVTAISTGASGNLPASSIVRFMHPIVGVDSVTNTEPIYGGTNTETDSELRIRYTHSIALGGASTVDSIRAALINTVGVEDAIVKVNNSDSTQAGRPPKSFEAYVVGGDDVDIANVIFNSGAAGIEPYGTETMTVKDKTGQDHIVRFSRATQIPIYVKVALTTDMYFPADGQDKVRTEILRYIGGIDTDGTLFRGIEMGQTVVYTQLVQSVLKIPGVTDVDIKCGKTTPPVGTANITMQDTQIATSKYDYVEVIEE